jgi:hypothetical protein
MSRRATPAYRPREPVGALPAALGDGRDLGVLVSLAVVALALAVGDAARRLLAPELRGAERLAASGGLGLGIVANAAFALAVLNAFRAEVLAAGALLLALVALVARDRTSLRLAWPARAHVPLLAAIAILLACTVPFLPPPEIGADAVYYHLTLARDLARGGSLPYEPYLLFSAFPLLGDVLYAIVLSFGGLDTARVMHFAAGLLGGLAIFALARRLRGAGAGIAAAFVWFATPLVLAEMVTAYVDLFAALYAGLACVFAVRWLEKPGVPDALGTGIFLGLGLATKLTVVVVAPAVLLSLLVVGARRPPHVAQLAGAAAAAAIIAAPQYLRSLLLTGNPVFPYLNGIFRSPLWEPRSDSFDHLQFGAGHGVLDTALLPARLVLEPGRFDQSPLPYLLAFPLLVAASVLVALHPRADRSSRFLAFVVAVVTALWFSYAQYARYLLPVFPAGAALAGAAVAGRAERRLPAALRIATRGALVASTGAAVAVLVALHWNLLDPLPFAYDVGAESREAYLTRTFRHFAMYRWISLSLVDGGAILGLRFSEAPILYSAAPIYRAEMTLEGRRVLAAATDADVLAALRAASFRYVLLDRAPRPAPPSQPVAASDGFAARALRLVHQEGVLALYAVPP